MPIHDGTQIKWRVRDRDAEWAQIDALSGRINP